MQLVSKAAYFDSIIDHKLHTHIMEALKKHVPGTKAIAVRFNKLVAELVEIQKAPGSHYKDRVIPPPMDPNSLFDINLSEELWRDESLDPLWMVMCHYGFQMIISEWGYTIFSRKIMLKRNWFIFDMNSMLWSCGWVRSIMQPVRPLMSALVLLHLLFFFHFSNYSDMIGISYRSCPIFLAQKATRPYFGSGSYLVL